MGNKIISKDEKIIDFAQGNKKYGVGDLYIKDTNYRCNKEVVCIYDDKSQNIHFYDKSDSKKMMDIERCVQKIQKKVSSILKAQYTNIYSNEENGLNGTLKIGRKFVKYINGECVRLFRYISVTIKGVSYELNFMRFFIDKDNRINCILGSPQYDRCIGKTVNQGGICYPTSCKGQDGSFQKIINKAEDGFGRMTSYCFNPNAIEINFDLFDGNDKLKEDELNEYAIKLANSFIKFISENENKSNLSGVNK